MKNISGNITDGKTANGADEMGYTESYIACDWCETEIGNESDVACWRCYEALEAKVADLEKEIERLKDSFNEKAESK